MAAVICEPPQLMICQGPNTTGTCDRIVGSSSTVTVVAAKLGPISAMLRRSGEHLWLLKTGLTRVRRSIVRYLIHGRRAEDEIAILSLAFLSRCLL